MRKYRIKLKDDGRYYPQYRNVLWWYFKRVSLDGNYALSFKTLEETDLFLQRTQDDAVKAKAKATRNKLNARIFNWPL